MSQPTTDGGPRRFTSDIVWVAASLATFAAAGAAWAVITSHGLGAGGRGNLSLIGVVIALAGLACSVGTGYTLPALLQTDRFAAGELVAAAVAIGLAVNVVVTVGVIVIGNLASVPVIYTVLVVSSLTLLPASWLKSIFAALLGARRDFKTLFVSGAAGQAVQLAIGVVLLVTGTMGVASAVAATTAGATVSALLLLTALRGAGLGRLAVRAGAVRQLLRAGAEALPGMLGQSLNYRVDLLVVASLAGAQVVGVYFVGVLVAETLFYPAQIVAQVLLPRAAQERLGGTAAPAYRLVAALTIAMAVALFVAAPYVVRAAFGPEFSEASPAARALMPGVIALALWQMATFELAGRGRVWLMSVSAFAGVGVTLVFDALLVPRWDVRGAAIAATIGYVTTAAIVIPSLRRVLGYRLRDLLLVRPSDLALASAELRALWRQRPIFRGKPTPAEATITGVDGSFRP
jgi:O-antigen/teichoic acid export membrane protein